MSLDLESLLRPISDDEPCGPDLSYDPQYLALFAAAKGKEEQRIGDAVREAESPDWREVVSIGTDVLGRTRDLRVAFVMTLALTQTEGWAGVVDGLTFLTRATIDDWDRIHPQLDPSDDLDPTERVNVLGSLAASPNEIGEHVRFRRLIREQPIAVLRGVGDVTWSVVERLARDESGEDGLDDATVAAIFREVELDALQATAQAIERAHGLVVELERGVDERVGASSSVNLDGLRADFAAMTRYLIERLGERGVGNEDAAAVDGADGDGDAESGAPRAAAIAGEVRSPQDARTALHAVRKYYVEREPSSPIPLLIDAALELVGKSYAELSRSLPVDRVEILENLAATEGAE